LIPAKQELVLGTGSLGVSNTREEAYRLLDAYIDLGGGILDTAAVYSDWVPGEARRSETIIGEWLKRSGKRPMIVTKGGHPPVANVHSARLDRASQWCRHRPSSSSESSAAATAFVWSRPVRSKAPAPTRQHWPRA